MKEWIRRSGLFVIFFGIVILTYAELAKLDSNTLLVVSGAMIFGGFLIYVILNNILD